MMAVFSKRSRRMIALSAATFLTPCALGSVAHAADAEPAAPAAAAADQGGLGDIVVTATRRSESVQKVPISMQAISMEKMAERNVKGMSDFAMLMPSVSFAGLGPGRQTAYFRGIVPAGGSYASVSYTHLDVYKRQALCRALSWRRRCRQGALFADGDRDWRALQAQRQHFGGRGRLSGRGGCGPVSYTHLDVYKRQASHSGDSGYSARWWPRCPPCPRRTPPCLLYTSRCV